MEASVSSLARILHQVAYPGWIRAIQLISIFGMIVE